MPYQIVRTELNEAGLPISKEVKINNIESEDRAISWLKSARHASIFTEANGRFVTEVQDWTFNVTKSSAAGDKIAINYSIKFYEIPPMK